MDEPLKNKIILMTGATSGLGKAAALQAASEGAKLIVLARNPKKASQLLEEHSQKTSGSSGQIEIVQGNLSSFNSIVGACAFVRLKHMRLDAIVHNAGVFNADRKLTEDWVEETLQVNLLAPMLINHLLLDLLGAGLDRKIIFTSSGLHQGEINFQNIEFKQGFSSFNAYRQSKLGEILLCRLLARRLVDQDIRFYVQHPGVVRTSLGRNSGWLSRAIFWLMGKSPQKGARTLMYLLHSTPSQLSSGEYYANSALAKTTEQAKDLEMAAKLLDVVQGYLRPFLKTPSAIFPNLELVI